MSKFINRRDFLKSSFLGVGALAVSFLPFRSFAQSNNVADNLSLISGEALVLCRQARELFYRKQYAAAATIYRQLIAAFPAKIEYYDGYAKTLNAEQKNFEAAELYRNGMGINPENPYFKHRLSLSLRRLAAGNRKNAATYQKHYGTNDLWQESAALLLAAIAIKPINDFKLALCDLPAAIEKQNAANEKRGLPLISSLPEIEIENINTVASSVWGKWRLLRVSHKEIITDVDISVENLKNKPRRNLHSSKEQKEREKATKKSIKKRYAIGLDAAITENTPGQVDKYGLKIVNEIAGDQHTIGKLRKYYRKQNFGNRLITLNRLLYAQNDNIINALALATALVKYENGNTVLQECRQLTAPIAELAGKGVLLPVHAACYYIVCSQINIRENNAAGARQALLEGLQFFDGRGGMAYTLME
ncbi:MAG: hypothetical protein LBR75_00070, partial [Prevotellaceae bacterium]|nr:hypothetical protein [Prevotellaceae bacterium]